MTVTHVFAGIPVADRDAAVEWYERLVGRAPDLIPNEDEAAWRMAEAAGWIYVLVDHERVGSGFLTLLVDDIDAFVGGLTQRGIVSGPIEVMDNGVRFVYVTDPDGNRLKVGQVPG